MMATRQHDLPADPDATPDQTSHPLAQPGWDYGIPMSYVRAADHRTDHHSDRPGCVRGDFSGIRRFAERDHENILQWSVFGHGGHFAAHKMPDVLVGDIRKFFGRFR